MNCYTTYYYWLNHLKGFVAIYLQLFILSWFCFFLSSVNHILSPLFDNLVGTHCKGRSMHIVLMASFAYVFSPIFPLLLKDFNLCLNCSDIPMAQFIINLNASMPTSQKFIIHILDNTHMFVQPHAAEMIRSAIAEFRDANSYEKPA